MSRRPRITGGVTTRCATPRGCQSDASAATVFKTALPPRRSGLRAAPGSWRTGRGPCRTRPAARGCGHEADEARDGHDVHPTQRRPGLPEHWWPEASTCGGWITTCSVQAGLRRRPRTPAAPRASAARPAPPVTAAAPLIVMLWFAVLSYAQPWTVIAKVEPGA